MTNKSVCLCFLLSLKLKVKPTFCRLNLEYLDWCWWVPAPYWTWFFRCIEINKKHGINWDGLPIWSSCSESSSCRFCSALFKNILKFFADFGWNWYVCKFSFFQELIETNFFVSLGDGSLFVHVVDLSRCGGCCSSGWCSVNSCCCCWLGCCCRWHCCS